MNSKIHSRFIRAKLPFPFYSVKILWSRRPPLPRVAYRWSTVYRNRLKKLHKTFGHPSSRALTNLLKKASFKKLDPKVRQLVKKITNRCKPCQTWQSAPARFRISFPTEKIMFNHEIEVDLRWIDGDPVLHIIDRGTRYSVDKFMESETSEHTWDLIMEFWVTVFTGYPYVISHDQGPQFTAEHFQVNCSQLGIVSKETPTQSHNSLSLCERYHSLIKRVYKKLKRWQPWTR